MDAESAVPVKSTTTPSVHSMVAGYTDTLASVQFVAPDGIKSRQHLGTGLTDGSMTGIGAMTILLTRDDVECAKAKSSAPVEPMVTGATRRCNDVSKK